MGLSKSHPPTQVKLLVSPTPGRIPWSLLSWLALGSGAIFFMVVILSGARLIVDPYSPNWLKTAFPGLVNSFEAVPQTADEIQAEIKAQNIIAGQPIAWPSADRPKAWFYPILSPDSQSIQALWVYRVRGNQRQRVEQITIRPLKESFITTPLVGTASQVASVDSDATLASVKLMPSPSDPWLLLEGQHRYGNTVMRYGQILSYQTQSQRLHRLLNWSSTGQPPQWRADQQQQQLIIDQTVGLRPSFLLYQLVPNSPPQLHEILLYRSIYESDLSTSLYDKALKLAQGAVWSHSLQMMQSAKKALGSDWSPAAQAQLDLIELHAKHTKAQTEQTLSSEQQHILAYLIDGQWKQALSSLEENPAIYDSTLKRIERDFDALWRGVTTHLQVHPNDEATQIWGALLVTARQSSEAGQDWLKQKKPTQNTLKRLQALDPSQSAAIASDTTADDVTDSTSASPDTLPATTAPGRYLSLVGQARGVDSPGEGWLRSQTLPTPIPGQIWYHIDIQLLQDSSGWGRPTTAVTAANFWAESLSLRRQMQLFSSARPTAGIMIHGVKATGSGLTLLAIGTEMNGSAVVSTGNSLQWLNTLPWNTAPVLETAPGSDISEPDAQISSPANLEASMVQTIGQQLGLTSEQIEQLYPHLRYTQLDLHGDSALEHIFSIGSELPSTLAIAPGQTIIFSSFGDVLYSDMGQQQSLLALIGSGDPATLLVERSGSYSVIGL